MSDVPTITRDELRALMGSKRVTVVDALQPPQYRRGHLPGAINIPTTQVRKLAPLLLPDKHAQVVVYCASFT